MICSRYMQSEMFRAFSDFKFIIINIKTPKLKILQNISWNQ